MSKKDDRIWDDIPEDEWDNMTDEEQEQIEENSKKYYDQVMFPDGHDDPDDDY